MTPLCRQKWIHISEVIDSLRIIPRLFLAACFTWSVTVTAQILAFYFHLPAVERTTEVTIFATGVQTAVLAFTKLVYDRYASSSRDWNAQPAITTTIASVTTTGTS